MVRVMGVRVGMHGSHFTHRGRGHCFCSCRLAERRIFDMVTRNRGIKRAPERWQRCSHADKFDLVVCFEERVFDTLIAGECSALAVGNHTGRRC